jgi:hypothetical protein
VGTESEDAASTEDGVADAADEPGSDTAIVIEDAEDEPVSDTAAEDGEPVGAAVADPEPGVEPAEETDESKE